MEKLKSSNKEDYVSKLFKNNHRYKNTSGGILAMETMQA